MIPPLGEPRLTCDRTFALQPAPVQVAYMAFAGSTGARFMHGIATDSYSTPPEYRSFYSEKLYMLPFSYHINSHAASMPRPRRKGADESPSPVLCSFNQYFKLDPALLAAWGRILASDSASTLLTLRLPFWEHAVPRIGAATNISADRITVGPSLPLAKHIERIVRAGWDVAGVLTRRADQLFSSSGLCAPERSHYLGGRVVGRDADHSTSAWAPWRMPDAVAGVRKTFGSRAAASIARAAGLEFLIARNLDEYSAIAIELLKKWRADCCPAIDIVAGGPY